MFFSEDSLKMDFATKRILKKIKIKERNENQQQTRQMIDSIVIQVKNVFNLFAVYYYEIWYYLNSPPSASV